MNEGEETLIRIMEEEIHRRADELIREAKAEQLEEIADVAEQRGWREVVTVNEELHIILASDLLREWASEMRGERKP